MVYRGRVENGVVVLKGRARPPDGTQVTVHPVRKAVRPSPKKKRPPTLYERLRPFVGAIKGLPPDLSINHDHYLCGTPKCK
ncbi:MAG: hypothetical protein FJ288_11045 [Planctomycetes bacterium]|nr:hypothetical protein [Planctomycetota bacterium]